MEQGIGSTPIGEEQGVTDDSGSQPHEDRAVDDVEIREMGASEAVYREHPSPGQKEADGTHMPLANAGSPQPDETQQAEQQQPHRPCKALNPMPTQQGGQDKGGCAAIDCSCMSASAALQQSAVSSHPCGESGVSRKTQAQLVHGDPNGHSITDQAASVITLHTQQQPPQAYPGRPAPQHEPHSQVQPDAPQAEGEPQLQITEQQEQQQLNRRGQQNCEQPPLDEELQPGSIASQQQTGKRNLQFEAGQVLVQEQHLNEQQHDGHEDMQQHVLEDQQLQQQGKQQHADQQQQEHADQHKHQGGGQQSVEQQNQAQEHVYVQQGQLPSSDRLPLQEQQQLQQQDDMEQHMQDQGQQGQPKNKDHEMEDQQQQHTKLELQDQGTKDQKQVQKEGQGQQDQQPEVDQLHLQLGQQQQVHRQAEEEQQHDEPEHEQMPQQAASPPEKIDSRKSSKAPDAAPAPSVANSNPTTTPPSPGGSAHVNQGSHAGLDTGETAASLPSPASQLLEPQPQQCGAIGGSNGNMEMELTGLHMRPSHGAKGPADKTSKRDEAGAGEGKARRSSDRAGGPVTESGQHAGAKGSDTDKGKRRNEKPDLEGAKGALEKGSRLERRPNSKTHPSSRDRRHVNDREVHEPSSVSSRGRDKRHAGELDSKECKPGKERRVEEHTPYERVDTGRSNNKSQLVRLELRPVVESEDGKQGLVARLRVDTASSNLLRLGNERDRLRGKDGDWQREKERDQERERSREREKRIEVGRGREKERQRVKEKEKERGKSREKVGERAKQREESQREKEEEKDRERLREKEGGKERERREKEKEKVREWEREREGRLRAESRSRAEESNIVKRERERERQHPYGRVASVERNLNRNRMPSQARSAQRSPRERSWSRPPSSMPPAWLTCQPLPLDRATLGRKRARSPPPMARPQAPYNTSMIRPWDGRGPSPLRGRYAYDPAPAPPPPPPRMPIYDPLPPIVLDRRLPPPPLPRHPRSRSPYSYHRRRPLSPYDDEFGRPPSLATDMVPLMYPPDLPPRGLPPPRPRPYDEVDPYEDRLYDPPMPRKREELRRDNSGYSSSRGPPLPVASVLDYDERGGRPSGHRSGSYASVIPPPPRAPHPGLSSPRYGRVWTPPPFFEAGPPAKRSRVDPPPSDFRDARGGGSAASAAFNKTGPEGSYRGTTVKGYPDPRAPATKTRTSQQPRFPSPPHTQVATTVYGVAAAAAAAPLYRPPLPLQAGVTVSSSHVRGGGSGRGGPVPPALFDEEAKVWFYKDPAGNQQGPCSVSQFKLWITNMQKDPSLASQLEQFKSVDVWDVDTLRPVQLTSLLRFGPR